MTSTETEQAIETGILLLREREQYVFSARANGCTHREIAQELRLSNESVRKILHNGFRAIRKNLRVKNAAIQTAHSCAVFALGNATDESLARFNCIVDFLISSGTSRFYVEYKFSHSAFMSTLIRKHPAYRKIYITVVTDGNDDIGSDFFPSGITVQCISDIESVNSVGLSCAITEMIEQSDYCLCDLLSVDNAEEIREHIHNSKRASILDLGKIRST